MCAFWLFKWETSKRRETADARSELMMQSDRVYSVVLMQQTIQVVYNSHQHPGFA